MGWLSDKVLAVTDGAIGMDAACVARMFGARAKMAMVDLHGETERTMAPQHAGNAFYLVPTYRWRLP